MKPAKINLKHSSHMWYRSRRMVPGGTHTISKRVNQFADANHYPAFIKSGSGATLTDVDGNSYIDYVAALAPIIIGYSDPQINEAITRQLSDGILFSLPSAIEIEFAETLVSLLPCAEKVRLFKTGAEATSAAVRLARAVSGREKVLSCGYQGWHDWWVVKQCGIGIPECVSGLTIDFPFGDTEQFLERFSEHAHELAAVILTPAVYGQNPPKGFLETIRESTRKHSVPLIFDEIITGFRWSLGGAQETYGIIPDLATYGKAMANGMPLAALAGNAELMDELEDNWVTSTYASEALSIAASMKTISILAEEPIYDRLYSIASKLQKGIDSICKKHGVPVTQGNRLPALTFGFHPEGFDGELFNTFFIRGCARRGVLIRRDPNGFSLCLIAALTDEDIAETLQVMEQSLLACLEASGLK